MLYLLLMSQLILKIPLTSESSLLAYQLKQSIFNSSTTKKSLTLSTPNKIYYPILSIHYQSKSNHLKLEMIYLYVSPSDSLSLNFTCRKPTTPYNPKNMNTGNELLCGRPAVTSGGIRVESARATQCIMLESSDSLAGITSEG